MAVLVQSISRESAGRTFRQGLPPATIQPELIFIQQTMGIVVDESGVRFPNNPIIAGPVDSPYCRGSKSFRRGNSAEGTLIFHNAPSPSLEAPDTLAFRVRHPAAAALIAPAREALLRTFPGSLITTRIDDAFDPDYGRPRDQLVLTVWVHARVDATDAIDRLDRFYDEWIPNHLDDDGRLLRFDVGIE